jgi:hypothetical protein
VAQPGQATVYVVFPGGGGRSVFSYNVFTVGSMVLAIVGAGLIILSNWAIQSCTSGDTTIIVR